MRIVYLKTPVLSLIGLSVGFFAVSAQEQDTGRDGPGSLTNKAWQAIREDDFQQAARLAIRCVTLYEADGLKEQAALTDFIDHRRPTGLSNPKALYNVGASLYIAGFAYEQLGLYRRAIACYRKLINDFYFCQCRANGGSGWWKPAHTAKRRLLELEFKIVE